MLFRYSKDSQVDHFTDVVSLLVPRVVTQVDAQRFVTSVTKAEHGSGRTTFFELYGQGGLSRAARRYRGLNVQGLGVLDLRSHRPDGEPWGFTRKRDRAWALRVLRRQRPTWAIAAPPCTAFAFVNHNVNYPTHARR